MKIAYPINPRSSLQSRISSNGSFLLLKNSPVSYLRVGMKPSLPALFVVLVAGFFLIPQAPAQLPTRWEQIQDRYQKDRSRGLIALNERYLEAYREELKSALAAAKLEEANAIQELITTLEDEIASLDQEEPTTSSLKKPVKDASTFLVGRSVTFPHNTKSDESVAFRFLENGKAIWVGLGGAEVDRAFRPIEGEPMKVYVWWPNRENDPGYEITVSEDGREAQVKNMNSQHLDIGEIRRDR